MRILLHTCCAPCLIFPLEKLRQEGFSVSGFFYNPNIHPFSEYKNRQQAVGDFSKTVGLDVFYPEYRPQEFFQAVNTRETSLERCSLCWHLRLDKTAWEAKEKGYTHFSSTLLVSPYQDQELLKQIGSDIAKEAGINFYYADFRLGFRKAHDQARAQGIYCQKYCGCIYGEIEQCRKSEKR